jgi:hypothetical protein
MAKADAFTPDERTLLRPEPSLVASGMAGRRSVG